MPTFSAGPGSTFTPSLTLDNWTLDAATAGEMARVVSIGFGGRLTTSTGYSTRWTRPTTAGATPVNFTASAYSPNFPTPTVTCVDTWTTEPVLAVGTGAAAENLHYQAWNAHGGLGYIVLPLANPWWIIGGLLRGQVSCRNMSGVDADGSSYSVVWEE